MVEIRLEPLPGTLTGRLTDAATGHPLVGASVEAGPSSTYTNADGRYHLNDLPPSAHVLRVSLDGYQTHESSITSGRGQNQTLDIALTSTGGTPPTGTGTMIVRVVDADTGDPIEGAAIIYATTAVQASTDAQPCADYGLLVPLKRSREYRTVRPRVADLRPTDAWQQDGLHFFVFDLRPTDESHLTPAGPALAVFAMRPDAAAPVSAVVVTPRSDAEPDITPIHPGNPPATPSPP
jgi:hypothetical protein